MARRSARVPYAEKCDGGDVVNSFEHECWKADISCEAL